VTGICTLVVCGAPLASRAPDVAAELMSSGWQVRVILTPTAEQWVDHPALEATSGAPGQTQLRPPGSPKPPRATAIAVVPITFNSIGKLANGIADTLAHSAMAEALGEGLPFVAVPMVNQYLAGNPAWDDNTRRLTVAGVTWVSAIDGTAGEPESVQSGSGPVLVDAFDPKWVSGHLPLASRNASTA
jgi:phosphopantothenoylcysteine decarboxylase